jgi:8-oxo-dGTP pyrophosphatase MutT (NUDIX family)
MAAVSLVVDVRRGGRTTLSLLPGALGSLCSQRTAAGDDLEGLCAPSAPARSEKPAALAGPTAAAPLSPHREANRPHRDRVAFMSVDQPAPGEELNLGEVTVPRLAATVILLRGGSSALEVLLVRRNPASRFMGGAWVFPGGAVDRHEGEGQDALRAAAIREVGEEAGIDLEGPAELIPFSRWITPAEVKIRFDTWFYLARAPKDQEPAIDGSEIVGARWYSPQAALDASRQGDLFLVFPTIKHLEQLSGFASADELIAHGSGREVVPVQPRIVVGDESGETARIVLPGDPGYED